MPCHAMHDGRELPAACMVLMRRLLAPHYTRFARTRSYPCAPLCGASLHAWATALHGATSGQHTLGWFYFSPYPVPARCLLMRLAD